MKPALLIVIALLGCGERGLSVMEKDGQGPPLTLKVSTSGEIHAGKPVVIRASVLRQVVDSTPLTLSVSLPSGVLLLSGIPAETIVDATTRKVERILVVRLEHPAREGSIVVQAQATGHAWGASARHEIPLGAPVAALSPPGRNGPPVPALGKGRPIALPASP